jgi:hypothetical protein
MGNDGGTEPRLISFDPPLETTQLSVPSNRSGYVAVDATQCLCFLMQDELDDILRYGAAELFADAVAASQKAQQDAITGDCH